MVDFLKNNKKMAEMKKLTYLFTAILMIAALGSCQQDDSEILIKDADAGSENSILPSSAGITPVILPGSSNGGNVTCAEVATFFELPAGYFLCGEKIDYSNGHFAGEFPEGLTVDVADGTYVSFSMNAPLMINGKNYVVGAVIVKGSNNANVYFYPEGIMTDTGLAAPVNASGKPAGLSNLTFCLVEVEPEFPEVVMVLKTYLSPDDGSYRYWAGTRGVGSDINSLHLGYIEYDFKGEKTYPLYFGMAGGPVGLITVSNFMELEEHMLMVKLEITEGEWSFYESFLYAGSAVGYEEYLVDDEGEYFTQYREFPFVELENTDVRIFKINVNELE
jgi:hypothetical protein